MNSITFTRVENFQDTTQVSQIIYDNIPVAWIEHDSKRVIVYNNNDWYYINGDNLTIRRVVESLGYKRYIVSWVERGEKYDVHDMLVVNAPQNTIRIFSNPNNYLEYSEYEDIELEL